MAMEISYSIVDLETQKIIAQKNQDESRILASVSKLYSFYYVMNQLDPMDTFKTKILKSEKAKLENGVLKGDLILVASGDPHLTAQNFINLIYQIKRKGIEKVEGQFIIDTQNLWSTERLSMIGLEDQADNSSMGALNFEFNRFKVDRSQNRPIPTMSYLKMETKKINEPGLKYQLTNKTDQSEHWIKNKNEKHKFREEIPTRQSNLFAGNFFRHLATIHGLNLSKPILKNKSKGVPVATHESLPVYRLLELGLEYSNNVIAEMLLQRATSSGPPRSAEMMMKWYQEKYPSEKFNWQKTRLVNASGLTLDNLTTSKNLSLLLANIYQDKNLKRNLISYLSISGHSGGIRKRFNGVGDSYRIYAKTGSLFFVNNLAGYFQGKSGKLYAFSLFSTDSKKRQQLNKENSNKVNQVRIQSKSWHRQSVNEIDKTLKGFMNKF